MTIPLRALRRATFERANNVCHDCQRAGEPGPLFWMLCIHHIDGNHGNNDPANLMVLCNGCHARLHIRQGDCGPTFLPQKAVAT